MIQIELGHSLLWFGLFQMPKVLVKLIFAMVFALNGNLNFAMVFTLNGNLNVTSTKVLIIFTKCLDRHFELKIKSETLI